MLHASTQKLIIKINELTEAGAIAWKEGEGARPCSVFESEGYVVEVTADPPTLRLLRADGREIERADASELASAPWPGGDGTFATQVAAMAARAHRVARGAEAAISRILSSLSAPPQRAPEPEPSPAAPEFEAGPGGRPSPVTRTTESEAAMAAISADMDSLRRSAEFEPLPQSHSAPEQQPGPDHSPQPVHRPMTISALLTSAAAPVPAAAAPAPEPLAAEAEPEPVIMEAEAAAVVGEPAAVEDALTRATPAPEPEPEPLAPPPVVQPPMARPNPSPGPQPQSVFGATTSFNRTPQAPARQVEPQPPQAKVTSGGLLLTGISAVTRQTIRGEPPPEPPKPAPARTPAPEPKPEPPRALATGPDIYKPWA